ncbi:SAV_2336 N-terminal domain-related protein [Streptomyces sp. bgisy027]|uniref:SAV_2336 N-terminal domain-related protein n=1 Tax=unclassified Streptomyces TaxID=2593676 RepID=UPI003D75051F
MTSPEAADPLAELLRRLRLLGAEPAPREVAESLWLARYLTPAERDAEAMPAREPADGPAPAPRAPGPPTTTPSGPAPPPDPATPPEGPSPLPAHLYADTPELQRPAADTLPLRVRAPAAATLPGSLPLLRALRPLRHYRPPIRTPDNHFDEQATAEQAAETGLLLPVLRPEVRREARLQLLMDVSSSTPVWDRTLDELHHLCASLGAFREVGVHYVHPGPGDTLLAGPGRAARALVPVEQLRDPTGRQVTLLLSDCAGPLWQDTRMQRLLHDWAHAAPVALVQPLPQRMWHETDLPALPGTLRRGEGLGARLEFTPADGERPPGALPVPVLGPTRAGFVTWARLMSGRTGLSLPAAAAWVAAAPSLPHSALSPDPFDAGELVAEFRASASPAAQSLVRALSAVPLYLEVMHLVQRVVLPESGPSVLAEVLLGGLLRQGTREEWYEFRPGVREELLRALPMGEAALVLKHCGAYVERHFGRRAQNFPALALQRLTGFVEGREAGEVADELRPFAEVSDAVVRRYRRSRTASRGPGPGESFVFVYAEFDQAWAAWLVHVLRECGFRGAAMPWRGGSLRALLDDALQTDRRVVLLLSDWLLFQHATSQVHETPEQLERFVGMAGDRVISFKVGDAVLPPVAALFRATDLSGMTERETRIRFLVRLGFDLPPRWYGTGGLPAFPDRSLLDGVPLRNPRVTGREELLDRLRDVYGDTGPMVCVLLGERGIGKTQVAAEFAHRHRNAYERVWWIEGDTLSAAQVEHVLNALRQKNPGLPWLIVFDNWDDTEGSAAIVPPRDSLHILITSRNEAWSSLAVSMRVDALGSEEVDGLTGDLVRRSLVHLDDVRQDGSAMTGSGFLVTPTLIVTSAETVKSSSPGQASAVVTTADGERHQVLWIRTGRELAVVRVEHEIRDAECMWLGDQSTVPASEVFVYGAPETPDLGMSREVLALEGATLAVGGRQIPPSVLGGPVIDPQRGCVVGVVRAPSGGGPVKVVPISSLRVGPAWLELVTDHDRYHWRRFQRPEGSWTVVQEQLLRGSWLYSDFTPEWRVELYGLLAELPLPDGPEQVRFLAGSTGGRDSQALPFCWRDGVGLVVEEGGGLRAVALYAARVCVEIGDRGATAEVRSWVERAAETLATHMREEILSVLRERHGPGRHSDGLYVLLEVERRAWNHRYAWAVKVLQGHDAIPLAEDDHGVSAEALGRAVAEPLAAAFRRVDSPERRVPLLYSLPSDLIDLPVERWLLGTADSRGAVGLERGIAVRSGSRDEIFDRAWRRRWQGVRRGTIDGLALTEGVSYRTELFYDSIMDAPVTTVPYFCLHDLPKNRVFDAVVASGYPLALWTSEGDHARCADFYRGAAELLSNSVEPIQLLEEVRQLRRGNAPWAQHVRLLFDPPDLLPPAQYPHAP